MMNHITIAARATPKGGAPSAGVNDWLLLSKTTILYAIA